MSSPAQHSPDEERARCAIHDCQKDAMEGTDQCSEHHLDRALRQLEGLSRPTPSDPFDAKRLLESVRRSMGHYVHEARAALAAAEREEQSLATERDEWRDRAQGAERRLAETQDRIEAIALPPQREGEDG